MKDFTFIVSENIVKRDNKEFRQIVYKDGEIGGYVSAGAVIENTYIAPNVFVGDGAVIKDSTIIADDGYINGAVRIENSTIQCGIFMVEKKGKFTFDILSSKIECRDFSFSTNQLGEIKNSQILRGKYMLNSDVHITNTNIMVSDYFIGFDGCILDNCGFNAMSIDIVQSVLDKVIICNGINYIGESHVINVRLVDNNFIRYSVVKNYHLKNVTLKNINVLFGGTLVGITLESNEHINTFIVTTKSTQTIFNYIYNKKMDSYVWFYDYAKYGMTLNDLCMYFEKDGNFEMSEKLADFAHQNNLK